MKKLRHIALISTVLFLGACSKDIGLTPGFEEFDVTTESTTYRVGDTVRFNIAGNPDLITFYSGELYNQYEFREGRKMEIANPLLSFTTTSTAESVAQTNNLSILVSSDFDGNYASIESAKAANWTDITSNFDLSANTSVVFSKEFDLSSVSVPGKPLFIAFRYITKPIATGIAKPFYIKSFKVSGKSVFGDHILGDMLTSNFRRIDQDPGLPNLSSAMSATQLTIGGYTYNGPPDADPGTETWMVTKGFDVYNLDNGRDKPVVLKGNEDSKLTSHTYVYDKQGVYNVHFVAANVNVDNKKQAVKSFQITIESKTP